MMKENTFEEQLPYSAEELQRDANVSKLFAKNHKSYWRKKRFIDVILSLLALIVLSPILLLISVIIWIDDPHGSPFFKQIRIGRHGKKFNMYKFRTMVVNADQMVDDLKDLNEADGPQFKIKNDPRITRVGKILRRLSLDELPQLINIIKGDMTIVGPRPPLPREVEQYNEFQKLRLMVTPGLTCHWQVQPDKNDLPFEEWVQMDIDYIGERTIWKDAKLVWETVMVVLKQGNS